MDPDAIDDLEIGANRLIMGPDGSEMSFVEHSGKAIDSGNQDLVDLENRMAAAALEPTLKAYATATGDALETTKANSALTDMALRLEDNIEEVFQAMADWLDLDTGGQVVVNRDFGLMKKDGSESGYTIKSKTEQEFKQRDDA